MSNNNEFPSKKNKKYFYQNYNKNKEIKQIESPIKYNYKIAEASQIENKGGNIYINNISIYSDREIEPNNENNNEINDDKNKESFKNKVYDINNDNNSNNNEEGLQHLYSFKSKEIPDSPKFSKNIFDIKNEQKQMKSKNNKYYNYNNNQNCKNISEKVETKIEKDNNITNNNKKEKLIIIDNIDNINDNDNNNFYDNKHIVSLGKLNHENKNNNTIDTEEIEKQKEEEFLMKEVLKVKSIKKVIEDEDEENGQENVIDEDDNDQEINLNMNKKKNNFFEYSRFSKNKGNTNKNISPSQTTIPKLRETKVKENSLKLLEDFIKSPKLNKGYQKNIDSYNNINNNKNNNLNKYSYIYYGKTKEKREKNKEEIKTAQNSPNNKIINKIYKIPFIKKTEIKNSQKLYSPNKNNIKVKNIKKVNTNFNISLDKNSEKINSFNIYNNKNNLLRNQGSYSKKNLINQGDFNKIEKKLFNNSEGKEKKIDHKKQKIIKFNEKILETLAKPKKIEIQQIKFSFTPEINKNSQEIWEKRNRILEENLKSEEKNSELNSNNKYKISIYDLLNEDAINTREKLREKYLIDNENIKLNSNLKKINDNSIEFAKNGLNRKIDNIINNYKKEKDEKLSFIQFAQCLCTMRLINELIKTEQIKDLNLKTFKNIVKDIKDKDKKKLEELEFLEQLWFILNPTLEEFINYELFSKIIKILFSSDNSKIKICSDDINNLLEEYEIKLQNNTKGIFISPLREKTLELKDIWQITKLIKIFLKLKSDLMGYKNNYSEFEKEKLKKDLMKEIEKEFSFHPDISKSKFVFKNPKYDYYNNTNDNLNKSFTNAPKIRKKNFNILYGRFMEEAKLHQKVLQTMREIQNQKEEKKCTLTPKITKYRRKNHFIKDKMNKSVDLTSNYNNEKIPIYERLYRLRKIYNHKKIKPENNDEFEEKIDSKNQLKDNKSNSANKNSKSNSKLKSKSPKIKVNEYAIKNKDINNNKNISKNIIYERKTQKIKKKFNNKTKNVDKKIIDDIYVIMNINLPKGGKKQIRIYKNLNNLKNIVNEFCKKNNINDENKKIIYKEAVSFKNNIFGKNINDIKFAKENFEDKQLSENGDANTNTNTND